MPRQIPAEELKQIAKIVAQHPNGVAVDEIRKGLAFEVSDRTLQRRLCRLSDDGRITARGKGRGKRYFPFSVPQHVPSRYPGAGSRSDRVSHLAARKNLARRAERPRIALALPTPSVAMKRALVALMRANEWQVLDLHFHGGGLPPGPPPHGVFVSDVWSHPRVQELHRVGCHLIRLGYVPSLWDDLLPAVVEDHAAAGRLAAEHFVGRRFRHVGFVGYGQMTLFKSMADPFRDHAQKLGAEFHLMLFPKLTKRQDRLPTAEKRRVRIHQLVQWFREAPTPIGMLAWSDNHGGRISVAAREAGLDIPSEVAVLGHGNEAWKCESAPVPLSSIDLGIVQQAEIAVGLMEQQLAGAPLPREAVVLPPAGIVVRQSSDALAVGDPVVARALRFMWDHLEQDLGTDDVADAVGINRRKLERMFHSHLGRSVRSVLRRRRLEQLKLLLRSTDLPIVDLAPQVGFRSAQYLSNAFRQDVGMSPRDYRQSHDRKIGA